MKSTDKSVITRRDFSKLGVAGVIGAALNVFQPDRGLACSRLQEGGYRQDLGRQLAADHGPDLGLS